MRKQKQSVRVARMSVWLLMLVLILPPVKANDYIYIPYDGYTYDEWGEVVPSATAYRPEEYLVTDDTGAALFQDPVDMVIDEEGTLYVLNGGSGGVVIWNRELMQQTRIRDFTMPNGETLQLVGPGGLYVRNGRLYIADTDQEMVIVCDTEGRVERILQKPQSATFPQEYVFRPQKVTVDTTDTIYVLVESIYQGAAAFDANGNFIEFFGSNRVEVTASLLAQQFWRLFMTDAQIDGSMRNVPVEYTNFDVDKDGFIYTCTAANETSSNEIRKLNAVGNNVLPEKDYGDHKTAYYKGLALDTRFVDIHVNDDGFIFGLDQERGRVFVYDSEGEEVFIFGGKGNQLGRFQDPVAIDSYGKDIYVLDNDKDAISVFTLTEYGTSVYEATVAFMDGRYEQSKELWQEVVMQNANCTLGYVGIGKALYQEGRYQEAMQYFELGGARTQESNAYSDWRKATLREYIDIGITAVVVILLLLFGLRWYKRQKGKSKTAPKEPGAGGNKFRELLYILRHPTDGFQSLKYHKSGSVWISSAIVLLWFAASVIERQYTHFRYNTNNVDETNIFFIFIATAVICVFFVIANWSVCTLFDGEGQFREIWIVTGYSLLPYAASILITTVLSSCLTLSESTFISFITLLGLGYSVLLLVDGMMQIHRYRFGQVLLVLVVSVIGIFLILFLCFLIIILFQQLFSFVTSVAEEYMMRKLI